MGVNYMYDESGEGHSPSKAVISLGEKKSSASQVGVFRGYRTLLYIMYSTTL